MDSPVRKLNPLLRLAAISGVETAVKLHIRRGDDLDARDGSGATPLALAAAKRRKGAVRLLLDAGANPALADECGMDALAHARKGGCPETIALLMEALTRRAALEPSGGAPSEDPGSLFNEEEVVSVEGAAESLPIPTERLLLETFGSASADESEAAPPWEVPLGPESGVEASIFDVASEEAADVVSLDDEPLDELSADDWEAEEEVTAPEGDETVIEAARQVHESIGRHKVVDRDEDWGDVDLHLPVRAAPLARDEGAGVVRDLFLTALREGMVSEGNLIEVCSNADGSRNDEAERLLAAVVGELGATVVEWTGSEQPFQAEPTLEEERLLTEATEFAEELASGRNDPFRFYSKDIRGDLLEAEEEIALGREMEEAGRAALSALAQWPEGLSALSGAAARVARGEADAESFSAGPEPGVDDESGLRPVYANDESDEDDDSELDEESFFFVNAVAAVEAARGDARRTTEALEDARLTRGFLLELTGKADRDGAGRDFVEALERQAAARDRMILSNLRLALSIAKKHLWSGIPLDDLVQEANIGLMKAVERFDWRRGFRFSTYATWWIRQQVSRSIADTGRVVRAPVHIQETARNVLREKNEVEARLGRPESMVETARRVGAPLAKIRVLLSMFDEAVSLDEIDPDTGLLRADGLPDTHALDPADVAEHASLRSTLLGMLDGLDERSREVILLRFGLTGEDTMTLEELGLHFGVTRERIRQIESKAMRRLSSESRRETLAPFLGHSGAFRRSTPPDESRGIREELDPTEGVAHTGGNAVINAVPAPEVKRDDLASKFRDEARTLGLRVHDNRAEGGELMIVAPYQSTPAIRAFGRRLIAFGFQKVQKDVFVI